MPRLSATAFACLALAAAGGVAFAGCGGGDENDPAGAPSSAAAPKATAGDVKVTMENIKFVPEAIDAKVGQEIVWENTDGDIVHNVTASDGAKFESGSMNAGATFAYTPTKAGKIAYVCTIHTGQNGSITVTK
ncbi:MAG: cupredoxin domain-containing protein [Solirubrobacteraceae bacterium]